MIDSIGTKIKVLRNKAKLTQSEFCGEFMNRTILSKIENNTLTPSIKQLEYIAEKLNISIHYFFNSIDYISCNDSGENFQDSHLIKLYTNCNYNEVIKLYEFDIDEFKQITDPHKNFYVGMSYFNLCIYNNAIKLLRKYITSYLKSSDVIQKKQVINFSISLNTISVIMFQKPDYFKVRQHLTLARKYLIKYNQINSTISSYIHNNLGHAYNCLNEFENVISILEEFIIYNKNGFNIIAMPNIHWSLGKAYYHIGQYDKAISHINKSIYLFKYNENTDEVGRCYINFLNILRYSKQFDEALNVIQICKREYFSNKILINKLLIEELAVYFNLEDFHKVLSLHKEIDYTQLNDMYRNSLYFILGHTYYKLNNLDKAKNYLIKCQKYFIEQNYSCDLSIAYEDLYNITKQVKFLEQLNYYKIITGKRNVVS